MHTAKFKGELNNVRCIVIKVEILSALGNLNFISTNLKSPSKSHLGTTAISFRSRHRYLSSMFIMSNQYMSLKELWVLTSISQLESIAFLTWIMTSISYTRVQGRRDTDAKANLSLCCLLRPLSIRDRDRDLHGHVSVRGRRRCRLANRVCYSKLHRGSHILYMRPSDHPPQTDITQLVLYDRIRTRSDLG